MHTSHGYRQALNARLFEIILLLLALSPSFTASSRLQSGLPTVRMSAAVESPSSYSTSYLAADTSGRLTSVAVVFIVLEVAFVVLREITRLSMSGELGLDNYLIFCALVANVGVCIQSIGTLERNQLSHMRLSLTMIAVMVRFAGVGRHITAALESNPNTLILWGKCIYALEWIYLPAVALPKLSLLSLYLRIFVKKAFRQATYVLMGLVICNWIAFSLASTVQCQPVAYLWDKKIRQGRCFDVQLFYRMVNIPNIATDVAMLVLPMPMVWQLQTNTARKVGLMIVLLTGSV